MRHDMNVWSNVSVSCLRVFAGWVQRSTADSTTCKWARSLLGVKVAVLRSQMHPSGGEIVKWWDSFKVNASQGPVLLQRFGPRFLGLGPCKTPYSAVRCNSGFLTQSLKTPDFLRLCPCRRCAMHWDHKCKILMSAWIWSALRIEMWSRLRVVKESLQQSRSKTVWLKLFDGCEALDAAELKLNSAFLTR